MKRKRRKIIIIIIISVIKTVSVLQSGCAIDHTGISARSPWNECSSAPLEAEQELRKNRGWKKKLKQIKLGKKILNKSPTTAPKTCCDKYYLN